MVGNTPPGIVIIVFAVSPSSVAVTPAPTKFKSGLSVNGVPSSSIMCPVPPGIVTVVVSSAPKTAVTPVPMKFKLERKLSNRWIQYFRDRMLAGRIR